MEHIFKNSLQCNGHTKLKIANMTETSHKYKINITISLTNGRIHTLLIKSTQRIEYQLQNEIPQGTWEFLKIMQ